ncbi:MAG TPA: sigma-54 dependent transcriptional regulator [Thermodesulfobacteriota bacterium]|nr:sigma-54 dependent transcriptional regulator [Thermodesulfobacteriota bacterium]
MSEKRILVIDDEEYICQSCRELLGEEGYEVKTSLHPLEGLKQLQEDSFDLLLLDLKMPERDGIQVLQEVKRDYPHLMVIIITGYATVDTAVASMKMGAFDYVSKPFTPDELLMAVEKAFEHQRLLSENRYLREELTKKYEFENLVGESEAIKNTCELIRRVAPTEATVLIHGESGTGKELVARAIHRNSPRRDKNFVVVDCAALAASVIESELFGYAKGAFTGATESKPGLLEVAEGGTIFLDEIANIHLDIQAKLLRVLQEQEFKRVGEAKSRKMNIRFVAATNRDLEKLMKEKLFREDLFYRLDVFRISLPPLRERKEDISLLASYFLNLFSKSMHKKVKGFSTEALLLLKEYHWPGNVRELRNLVERLIIMNDETIASSTQVSYALGDKIGKVTTAIPRTAEELKKIRREITQKILNEIENSFVIEALKRNNWNVTRAAEEVGLLRPNFHALMRKHNITIG